MPKAQASIKESKDQFENFLKHTEKGIEFSEKYANFVKQRAEYEVEHAKNLRKLVKAFQPKKKGKTYGLGCRAGSPWCGAQG